MRPFVVFSVIFISATCYAIVLNEFVVIYRYQNKPIGANLDDHVVHKIASNFGAMNHDLEEINQAHVLRDL